MTPLRLLTTGLACFLVLSTLGAAERTPDIAPSLRCTQPAAGDQDDLCIWVHPRDPAASRVIAADKAANRVFVYDLQGKLRQSLEVKHPGNIDLRRGVRLGAQTVDVVALNGRQDRRIYVFRVDADGELARFDDDAIATGDNYGGALFCSPKTGKLYFVSTSGSGRVEQIELFANARGGVSGRKVREWKYDGICEAAVGDDETGRLYISEERRGVWALGGEPHEPARGALVIRLGEHGLRGDVEGLALFRRDATTGYLIVSNQGASNFKVYRREPPHAFVGTFAIAGVRGTDGIEVCATPLGPDFPAGVFGCHSDEAVPRPIVLTSWQKILATLP